MALKYTLSVFAKPKLNYINCSKITIRSLSCTNSRQMFISTPNLNVAVTEESKEKPPADNKLTVDGVPLYWEKFGDGPHIALCLPGLVGSIRDNFLPVSKKMDLKKFTLIAWDPPGYGKSRPPDRNVFTNEPPLKRDARLAGLLMKELGYDRYSTIGWSNGGITGAMIAASFPDTIHKVVLCNSPLKLTEHFRKIMEIMIDLENWTPQQRTALLGTYGKQYAMKMLKDWKKYITEETRKQTFTRFYLSELKKIRSPTLMIQSKGDIVVPMPDAKEYARRIQNSKLEIIPKGGHSHLEFLPEFVAATEAFLAD